VSHLGLEARINSRNGQHADSTTLLVTLISSAPEVQWVALRNINLLLQKRPDILANEMRVFFCKYNDPPYVKVEKLDVMVRLASERNVDTLLGELKECVLNHPSKLILVLALTFSRDSR
jgi:vesicle coat complex subunit